jgi:hypothetical protein
LGSSVDTAAYGEYINFDDSKRACPMGFGVPTEAELKAETTEAKVNRVTNLIIFLVLVTVIHEKCLILNTTNTKTMTMTSIVIELRACVVTSLKSTSLSPHNDFRAGRNNILLLMILLILLILLLKIQ